jgi:opacity protein-like surface antigen
MRKTAIAAAFAVALLTTPAVASEFGCWGGVSAGKGISSTRISDDISGPVTISADGLQGGVELGCDLTQSVVVIGAMARYEILDLSGQIGNASYSSDAMWTVALRGGIKINPDLLAYGLVGLSGTDMTLPGISLESTGITYGAGLEFKVAIDNLKAFVEWTRSDFDPETALGTHISPSTDVVRVGVRYKFNFSGGK